MPQLEFEFSDKEYQQIEALAAQHKQSVEYFMQQQIAAIVT